MSLWRVKRAVPLPDEWWKGHRDFKTQWFLPCGARSSSHTFPKLLFLIRATICSRRYRSEGTGRKHDNFGLFHYVLEGNGVFRDADGEHPVTQGQGFLCRVSDPRTAYYAVPEGPVHWECLGITFSGTAAMLLMEDLISRFGPVFSVPRHSVLIERFLAIGRRQSCLSAEESSELVFSFLQSLEGAGESESSTMPALVRRALHLIEERTAVPFNVSALGRELRVSREHLTRVMQQSLGKTPHEIIRRKKIVAACRLLRETDFTVKEIAGRLGYTTPAVFIEVFKKSMNTTPAAFRRDANLAVPTE